MANCMESMFDTLGSVLLEGHPLITVNKLNIRKRVAVPARVGMAIS